jgi:branched-chain amino acid transport system permease protein
MLQLLISGIIFGSAYALLAMSFNVIYRVAHVVNFAQGEIMTLAALVTYSGMVVMGQPAWLVVPVALLFAMGLSFVIDHVAVRPVWRFGGSGRHNYNWILSTFGASVLLQNVFQQIWGAKELHAPSIFGTTVLRIGDAGLTTQDIGIVAVAVVIFVGLHLMNTRTLFGKASEGVSENQQVASLMGIRPSRVITFSWLIAGLVAGVTGILIAPVLVLTANMGFFIAIKAFIAMMIGGIGNAKGAIIAGFALGIYESILSRWLPGGYVDAITFAILVLLLFLRPSGIFGKGEVVRA